MSTDDINVWYGDRSTLSKIGEKLEGAVIVTNGSDKASWDLRFFGTAVDGQVDILAAFHDFLTKQGSVSKRAWLTPKEQKAFEKSKPLVNLLPMLGMTNIPIGFKKPKTAEGKPTISEVPL